MIPKIEIRVDGMLVYSMPADALLMVETYKGHMVLPYELAKVELKVIQGRNTQAFLFEMPVRSEEEE
jgi:hypothetical protein